MSRVVVPKSDANDRMSSVEAIRYAHAMYRHGVGVGYLICSIAIFLGGVLLVAYEFAVASFTSFEVTSGGSAALLGASLGLGFPWLWFHARLHGVKRPVATDFASPKISEDPEGRSA